MINNTKKLLEKIEGKQLVSDKFHDFTNNKKFNTSSIKAVPQSWIKIHFKTYPRLDSIRLNDMKVSENNFIEILKKRRSIRQYANIPISKKNLYDLLFLSSGITHLDNNLNYSKRSYPSAGKRYPLEVYPIILNCEGIKKGLYHYNVKENSLELLLNKNLSRWLIENMGGEKWITNASVVFIITGVLDRVRIKYGERGYRLILIEVGHLSQNMLLLATSLGLGGCPIAGFIDSEVNKLLDINLQKEVVLYMVAVGKL